MGAEALVHDLKGGAIFSFPFSFRGGLDPDTGFLLTGADGTPFLAVGKQARLEFVTLRESADPDEAVELDEDETDDDSVDFGMM
jgi:hypothetical protein